jgi:hypothetical protein
MNVVERSISPGSRPLFTPVVEEGSFLRKGFNIAKAMQIVAYFAVMRNVFFLPHRQS